MSQPQSFTIQAIDGYPLAATAFAPEGRPRALVLVLGGTAIKQRLYRRFAIHLADHGFLVVTFDYRGIGGSRPAGSLRSLAATISDWAKEDIRGVLRWAELEHPKLPRVAVGHSFGAQSIGLVDELSELDAAVLVTAQFGYYGMWPAKDALRFGLLVHVVAPTVSSALGYYPGGLGFNGVDLPGGVAREWAKWCRSPHYLLDHEPAARARLAEFRVPTQMWSFTDDDFAPEAAVNAFERRLVSAPRTHLRLEPAQIGLEKVGHFGFFRESMSPSWARVIDFLDQVIDDRFVAANAGGFVSYDEVMQDLTYGWS